MNGYSAAFRRMLFSSLNTLIPPNYEGLLDELSLPIERVVGKIWLAYLEYSVTKESAIEELVEQNLPTILEEPGIYPALVFLVQYSYYSGANEPQIDENKANESLDKAKALLDDIEGNVDNYEWEWNALNCLLNLFMGVVSLKKDELAIAIHYHETAVEFARNLPEFEEMDYRGDNNLGVMYFKSGRFEEAERELFGAWDYVKGLIEQSLEPNTAPFVNLGQLLLIQGKITSLRNLITEALELGSKYNNTRLTRIGLRYRGKVHWYQNRHEEAERDFLRYVELGKGSDSMRINSLLLIIDFYEEYYRVTKNRVFLDQAYHWLDELERLEEILDKRTYWQDLTLFRQAKLQSHGNIIEKAKALQSLQDLCSKYPENIAMQSSNLDLLFQDMIISENDETKNQIGMTISLIEKIPLRNNPNAVLEYTMQQNILSQYAYYIEGDVNDALDKLYELKEQLIQYQLPMLVDQVNSQIQKYESEISKWQETTMSTRERILNSKITDYLHEAIKSVDLE